MPHVTYYPDEGITPHYDPFTESCISIVINGLKHWQITSYSIEEKNDGSQVFHDIFAGRISRSIQAITELENNPTEWVLLSDTDQHNLSAYKIVLQGLNSFPPGFTMPTPPPVNLSPVNIKRTPKDQIIL
jgi:hypothetical protein